MQTGRKLSPLIHLQLQKIDLVEYEANDEVYVWPEPTIT